MIVTKTIADCRNRRREMSGKLALVPTMGALHAGHMSLIEAARRGADHVAVSIFVNPTQFGPTEDLSKYPRTLEVDLAKCETAGVELIFNPSAEEMYPPGGADLVLDLPSLTSVLEGKHRPGHFKGVCQVVAKLFNIIEPQTAYFGRKDFQQLRVLQAMVAALDFPLEIIACATLREPDGMAMSSRNRYLSEEDHAKALSISRGLFAAKAEFDKGITQTNRLIATVQKQMLEQHLSIDYVAAVDPMTLKNVEVIERAAVLAVAARVGNTRLIDNLELKM
jgi:pantoate--beta-alanine ligase